MLLTAEPSTPAGEGAQPGVLLTGDDGSLLEVYRESFHLRGPTLFDNHTRCLATLGDDSIWRTPYGEVITHIAFSHVRQLQLHSVDLSRHWRSCKSLKLLGGMLCDESLALCVFSDMYWEECSIFQPRFTSIQIGSIA